MKKILLAVVLFSMMFIGCEPQGGLLTINNSYDKYKIEMVAYSKSSNIAIYEVTGEGEKYLIFRTGNSGIFVIKKNKE